MADVTIRDNTRNQATFDYLVSKLLLGRYTTRRIDYANISGAEETVVFATVMGRVDATGKLVPCLSTATDGSQEPVTILLEELTAIAIAATVDSVLTVDGGELDKANIIFHNGTDLLTTIVTNTGGVKKSMEDFLIQNGNSYEFLAVNDSSKYDN